MDTLSRISALDRQSRDYLRLAFEAPADDQTAAGAAYQAGYFALVSTLSADEISTFSDHPNPRAAALASQRLHLPFADQAMAEAGAATYYAPDAGIAPTVDDYVAWARRARVAVGWAP